MEALGGVRGGSTAREIFNVGVLFLVLTEGDQAESALIAAKAQLSSPNPVLLRVYLLPYRLGST